MQLKIFISHSAKKDCTRTILATLYDTLAKEENIVPILDKEDLVAGASWRSTINVWLGSCDAAVVLICRDALKSDYVAYETSVLAYRHTDQNDGFTLIPVFIDGVDYPQIQESRLSPSFIQEIQGFAINGNANPNNIMNGVVSKLRETAENARFLEEPRFEELYGLLKNIGEVGLKGGYRAIVAQGTTRGTEIERHNLEKWFPGGDLPLKLALKMTAAGFKGSAESLRSMRKFLPEPIANNLKYLMDLLSSSWVDHKARKLIRELPSTCSPLGIQTEEQKIVEIYVKCASHLPFIDSWRVIGLNSIYGHDFDYSTLKKEVEKILKLELEVEDTAQIRDSLGDRSLVRDYIFVVIPGEGIPDTHIGKLSKEENFKEVVFVKMKKFNSAPLEVVPTSPVTWLNPPLEQVVEDEFLSMDGIKVQLLKGVQ